MKRETITQYVAKDGKTFKENNHLECAWYELMLAGNENINFYDAEEKPVKFDPLNKDLFLKLLFEKVYYINIHTDEMAGAFADFLDEIQLEYKETIGVFDYYNPQAGFYFFEPVGLEWRNWQAEMEWLRNMADKFQLFEEELPLSFEEVLGEEA